MNVTEEIEVKKRWAALNGMDYYYEELKQMDKFDYFVRPTVFRHAAQAYPKVIPSHHEHVLTSTKAEWLWWLDIDTIFMEPEVNFTKFILSQEAFDNGAAAKGLLIKDILSKKTWKIEEPNKYEDTDLIVTQ